MRFKEFYEAQQTIGTIEEVEIDGIGRISARIDTGNTGHNVLHAINVSPFDKNKVRFATIDNKTLEKDIKGTIEILAGGQNQNRYVVNFNLRIGSQFFQEIPFSLADRSSNQEKVLIGEPFLRKMKAIVDTDKAEVV
jgi:hypothetical protein